MTTRTEFLRGLVQAVGVRAATNILARRVLRRASPVKVTSGRASIKLRPSDSDLHVAAQIFGLREYEIGDMRQQRLNDLAAAWRRAGKVPVIVDGGANVGYSSIFLANAYRDAVVLAVEPDEQSFDLLVENCAAFDSIIPVRGALWSHDHGVSLQNLDAASWGRAVKDGGSTPSFTLDTLLARIPEAQPLVLKLDIEGGERDVCAASPDLVRAFACIMVEPHDWLYPGAGSLSSLFAAVAGKEMDTLLLGEILILSDCAVAAPKAEHSGTPLRVA